MSGRDRAVEALARTQWSAFSARQARALGFDKHLVHRRVASGHWRRTGLTGVFVLAGHPASWEQRLQSALLWAGPGSILSCRSAAALWGLDRCPAGPVALIVPTTRRLASPLVEVHRRPVAAADRRSITGFDVTSPERTLVDLAGEVAHDVVDDALESAVRLGLTTPDRLRDQLAAVARPGRPGVRPLRALLDGRPAGAPRGSPLEGRLVRLLRRSGLPEPVRQHELVVGGRRLRIDLAYPDRRLAVEVDGRRWHSARATFNDDRSRQNALVLAGWHVLRFTADQIRDDEAVVVAAVAARLRALSS